MIQKIKQFPIILLLYIVNCNKFFIKKSLLLNNIYNDIIKNNSMFDFRNSANVIITIYHSILFLFRYKSCLKQQYIYQDFNQLIFKLNINHELVIAKFDNCFNLRFVYLNTSTVFKKMFYNCIKLKYVKLGKNVKYIEREAFRNCINLKIIYIPKTIISINTNTFKNCISLKKIIFY